MAVTFNTLKKDAVIFSELQKEPEWWKRFKSEKDLYIEIRKDNQVNVYFEGGSVARIHYCSKHKELQVFTHRKYLYDGQALEGKVKTYVECRRLIEGRQPELELEDVLRRVKGNYSRKNASGGTVPMEKWSEKYIQARLISGAGSTHLDAEFAYKDNESDVRIDLVNVVEGAVTFVELKRLDDVRMLKSTDDDAEVVAQMEGYRKFIGRYKAEILDYYQRVYDIKESLGLPVPASRPERVAPIPELLIFNRWEKKHPARDKHRKEMEERLLEQHIVYRIIDRI